MTHLFLMVAEQSLRVSGIILFLWALRAIVRKIPGSALYLLWILVFVGLLFPFRVEVPYHTDAPASAIEAVILPEDSGTAAQAPPDTPNPSVPQGETASPKTQAPG